MLCLHGKYSVNRIAVMNRVLHVCVKGDINEQVNTSNAKILGPFNLFHDFYESELLFFIGLFYSSQDCFWKMWLSRVDLYFLSYAIYGSVIWLLAQQYVTVLYQYVVSKEITSKISNMNHYLFLCKLIMVNQLILCRRDELYNIYPYLLHFVHERLNRFKGMICDIWDYKSMVCSLKTKNCYI